jgi:hypothetical protein
MRVSFGEAGLVALGSIPQVLSVLYEVAKLSLVFPRILQRTPVN